MLHWFPSCTWPSSPTFLQNTNPSLVRKHWGFEPIVSHEQFVLGARPTQLQHFAQGEKSCLETFSEEILSVGQDLPSVPETAVWLLSYQWSVLHTSLGHPTPWLQRVTNPLWVKCSHSLLESHRQRMPCFKNKLCHLQDFQKAHFLFQQRAASDWAVGCGQWSPLGDSLFRFWRDRTWGSKALGTERSASQPEGKNKIQVVDKSRAHIMHNAESVQPCCFSTDKPGKVFGFWNISLLSGGVFMGILLGWWLAGVPASFVLARISPARWRLFLLMSLN